MKTKIFLILLLSATAFPAFAETEDERTENIQPEVDEQVDEHQLGDGYRLAIDPDLLKPNEMAPNGEERTERNEKILRPKPLGAVDYVAWVPRVIFFPLHLLLEYGVRWPLGVATVAVEKNSIIDGFLYYTSWDDGNGSITPRFDLRSGFKPSIGLNVSWENMIWEGNDYSIGADIGFANAFTFDVQTRQRLWDDALTLSLNYQYRTRSDFIFHGVGDNTSTDQISRFFQRKNAGGFDIDIAKTSTGLGATTSFQVLAYEYDCAEREEDICGADGTANTADDLYDLTNETVLFSSGYSIFRMKGGVYLDTRSERPEPGSGIRLDLFGQVGTSINDVDANYVKYGGEAAAFWDFYKQRIIGIRLRAEFAEAMEGSQIPFGELATLGGIETMRGFSFARFHGQSSLVATLDYRYPVWSFLDANLFFEVGNTFNQQLEDFELGALRPNLGLSIKANGSRFNAFDITLGLGGYRFDDKIGVDSFTLGLGTNWGF